MKISRLNQYATIHVESIRRNRTIHMQLDEWSCWKSSVSVMCDFFKIWVVIADFRLLDYIWLYVLQVRERRNTIIMYAGKKIFIETKPEKTLEM